MFEGKEGVEARDGRVLRREDGGWTDWRCGKENTTTDRELVSEGREGVEDRGEGVQIGSTRN